MACDVFLGELRRPRRRSTRRTLAQRGVGIVFGERKRIEMDIATDQPVLTTLRRPEFDDYIRSSRATAGATLDGVRGMKKAQDRYPQTAKRSDRRKARLAAKRRR